VRSSSRSTPALEGRADARRAPGTADGSALNYVG
jgi:hypothetical protein